MTATIESLEQRTLLAAVLWDGGGDGTQWSDPLNWSDDALPAPGDDVTIPGTIDAEVQLATNVTIASLTSQADLHLTSSGSLTLTGGASHLDGAFRTTPGATLTADGDTAAVTVGSADVDISGGSYYAKNGGTIEILGATYYEHGNSGSDDKFFRADGPGSRIDLSNVTTLINGTSWADRILIQAVGGGIIDFGGVEQLTEINDGDTRWRAFHILSDGSGSRVELDALTALTDMYSGEISGNAAYSSLTVRNGGTIDAPLLTNLDGVYVDHDGTGSLPMAQFATWTDGRADLSGQAYAFPALTNAVGTQFVIDGVHADLSSVTTLQDGGVTLTGGATADLGALKSARQTGFDVRDGVTLDLPVVRDITGASFRAYSGATIDVSAATRYEHGSLGADGKVFRAEGAGSRIDLSNVTTLINGTSYDDRIRIEAVSGGVVDLTRVEQITEINEGDTRWRAVHVSADGADSRVELDALTTFTDIYAGATNGENRYSELTVRNGGAVDAPLLTNLDGVHVTLDGTGSLPIAQWETWKDGRADLSGLAYAFPALTNAVGTQFVVDGIHADLSSVTTLQDGGVTLTGGATADLGGLTSARRTSFEARDGVTLDLPVVKDITGASFRAYGGSTIDVSAATNYDHGSLGADGKVFRAEGAGSRIDLSNVTTLINGTSYDDRIYVQAYAGGVVDLSRVGQITEINEGDTRWRAVHVTADGADSRVELDALSMFTDVYAGATNGENLYSSLTVRNGGAVDAPLLTNLDGVHVTLDGTGSLPIGQFATWTDGRASLSGQAYAFPALTSAAGTQFVVDGIHTDLSSVTTLQDGGVTLTGSATADLGAVTNAVRASFEARDGVTLDLPVVSDITGASFRAYSGATIDVSAATLYDHGTSGADHKVFRAEGAGSRIDLSNVTTLINGTSYNDRILLDAIGGGVIDLSSVNQITELNERDTRWRAVRITADGTDSRVELDALTVFTDVYAGATNGENLYSSLEERDGGIIDAPQLTRLEGVRIPTEAVGGLGFTQLVGLKNSRLEIDGTGISTIALPALTESRGTAFDVSGPAVLDLNSVTRLFVCVVTLSGGGRVQLDNVRNVDGTMFTVRDGVTLAMPMVTQYDHSSAESNDKLLRAEGAGSRIDLSNVMTIINGTSYADRILIQAYAGGVIDLSNVRQIVELNEGDKRWRAVHITADGTGSLVDLQRMENFIDHYGTSTSNEAQFSTVTTSNGGSVRLDFLTNTQGVRLNLDGTVSTPSFTSASTGAPNAAVSSSTESLPEAGATATGTVHWIGGNGNWNDASQWSTGTVPGPGNDVVISDGGADLTVTITEGNVAVRSLQSDESLTIAGGSLKVTGPSEVRGTFSMAVNAHLIADGSAAFFLASGNTTAPSANLSAYRGGVIQLPNLTTYTHGGGNDDKRLRAIGPGSRIELPNVTTLTNGTSYADRILIEAQAGGVIDLSGVTEIVDPNSGDTRWRAVHVTADGPDSRVEFDALTTFTDVYAGATNSENVYSNLIARNGGTVDAPLLATLQGVNVVLDGTGNLPIAQFQSWTNGRAELSGHDYLFSSLTSADGTQFLVQGVHADLSGVTTLQGGGLTLTVGGTANVSALVNATRASFEVRDSVALDLSSVNDATGASFDAYGGATIDVSSVTAYDHGTSGSNDKRFRAVGPGSVINLSNVTTLTNGTSYADRILIEALAGGVIDLSGVMEIVDPNSGDTRWRAVHVTADGPDSRVAFNALTTFTDVYAGATNSENVYSNLIARNGGTVVAPLLATLQGVNVVLDGTGNLPIAQFQSWTGGRADLSGHDYLFSSLTSAAGTHFLAHGIHIDLSSVTTIQGGGMTLTAGGTVDVGALVDATRANIEVRDGVALDLSSVTDATGASFDAYGGATIDVSSVTAYDHGTSGSDDKRFRAVGPGSVINLSNVTTLTNGTSWADRILIEVQAGGVIDLSGVTEIVDPNSGDTRWRAVHVTADGPDSRVELDALTTFTDVSAGSTDSSNVYSNLIARNGGTVDAPLLATLQGINVVLDGTGNLPIAQFQSWTNGRADLSGQDYVFSSLTSALQTHFIGRNVHVDLNALTAINGASFQALDGATLNLSSVTVYDHGSSGSNDKRFRAVGLASLINLSNVTTLTNGTRYADRILIEAFAGGVIDLSGVTEIVDPDSGDKRWQAVHITADGAGSRVEFDALTTFTDVYAGSTGSENVYSNLIARNGGTVDAPALMTLQGVNVVLDGTGTLPVAQFATWTNGRAELSGTDYAFPALTTGVGTHFIATHINVDLSTLTDLSDGGLALHDGASAVVTNLSDIDGTDFETTGGSQLVVPGPTSYSHPSQNRDARRLRAVGSGSLISLPNVTTLTNGTSYADRIDIEAFAGGVIDLSSVTEIVDFNTGDQRYRSVNVLADGVSSRVDLGSLQSMSDSNAGSTSNSNRYSQLTAVNSGIVELLPSGTSLTGVLVTLDQGGIAGGLDLARSSRLSGVGSVSGSVVNGGTIEPDKSLTFGEYRQLESGLLTIEIAGSDLALNDVVTVNGPAALDGVLNIVRVGDFTPSVGETFPVVTSSERTGEFDLINGRPFALGIKLEPVYTETQFLLSAIPDQGPRVVGTTATGTVDAAWTHFDLQFDEPIDEATLTADDVTIVGPNGVIAVEAPIKINETLYYIPIAIQITPGTYTVTIGPDVTDLGGNPMNQDDDGTDGEPTDDVFTTSITITDVEEPVLFVNVNGSYNNDGWNFYQTLLKAGSRALGVNLDTEGMVAELMQMHEFEQVWVYDLSSGADNYAADWTAIADWFNTDPQRAIIADGRIISSYWNNRWTDEGQRLTENYYRNIKQNGGGLVLGTDHSSYHSGINSINDQIGIDRFSGNFNLNTIPVDVNNPLMNTPNDMGGQLYDDSSPGLAPFGLQPNGRILYSVAWHSGNFDTPGISATIPGTVGLQVDILQPVDNAQFTVGQTVTFEAQQQGATPPVAFTWMSNLDGTLGTGATLETSSLSIGTHTITVVATDAVNSADSDEITVTIVPLPAEVSLDLQSGSDSGASQTDNLTNDTTPTFDVSVNQAGLIEVDFDGDGTYDASQQVDAAGTYAFTAEALNDDGYQVRVRFAPPTVPADTAQLGVTIDTVGPHLLDGMPTEQAPISSRTVRFSEAIDQSFSSSVPVSLTGPAGVNVPLTSISGSGSTYTLGFDPVVAPGEYTLTAGVGIADLAGNLIDQNQNGTGGEQGVDNPVDTFTLLADTVAPIVQSFSPLGFRNTDVTELTITFNELMSADSFTGADVQITGPNGPVDTSALQITAVSDRSFRLTGVVLTDEGDYAVEIGPGVTDLSGNALASAYAASITVDKTGPRITGLTPAGTVHGTVGHVDVTFDSALDGATFRAEDVTLTGPEGAIDVNHPVRISGNTWRIGFAPQRANGDFTVAIGPNVLDRAGNAMDQNANGTSGESADAFSGSFSIALPDLRVDPVVVPTTAEHGQTMGVEWTVHNEGTVATSGGWADEIYLSADDQFGAGNRRLLRHISGSDPLAAGQSRTFTQSVILPREIDLAEGPYYLLVITDADGLITEAEETDNVAASNVFQLQLPQLPDFEVTSVIGPANASAGEPIVLTWTIHNGGNQPATGTWTEQIFVSGDAALGNDRLVGTFTHEGTLAAGGSLDRTQSITLPLTGVATSGDLHFVVRVDADEAIFESNEQNNAGITSTATNVPAVLSLSVPTDTVPENAANPTIRGVVTRSGDYSSPLVVHLASSDGTELTVPATVTIPAGQYSAPFDITVQNDAEVDGTQPVLISASADGLVGDDQVITVQDDDVAALSLVLDASNVSEGGSITGTITRPIASEQPQAVQVAASASGQFTFPLTVVIPTNETSATFTISAVDDQIAEKDETVTFTVSANGFTPASADVTVLDDDGPELTLTLSQSAISEGAGQGLVATVTRAEVTNVDLTIRLRTSDASGAVVPSQVVIPAGRASVDFLITPVDDALVDGTQLVTITAMGVYPSCGCSITSSAVETVLEVLDDDGPTLTVRLTPEVIRESATNPAATGTVTRNTDTSTELTVTLASSDAGEATVPQSVVIPAGQTSVTFPIHAVDDGVSDGSQTVVITATAAEFTPGTAPLTVTDAQLPDLVVSEVDVPSSALTETFFDIGYRIENQGLLEAAADNATSDSPGFWQERVFLSNDDAIGDDLLVGTYTFEGTLPADLFYQRTIPVRAPLQPGNYRVVVVVDLGDTVSEILESNNARISTAFPIEAAYSATVQTDVDQAVAGTDVPLYGTAVRAGTGAPAAFELVNIHLQVRGTERVIAALTDANGNFTATFRPLPGEAGVYTIGASHPGVNAATVQDGFTLIGMRAEPPESTHKIVEGTTAGGQFTLHNQADIELTGLAVEVLDAPENLDVDVDLGGQTTLGEMASLPVNYEITATDASVLEATVTLRITTAEGATLDVPVDVTVEALRPRLVADVGRLQAGMLRGSQRSVEFTVTNQGGIPTGPIAVELPDAPWLSAATDEVIPSIAPGESATVVLLLTPAADLTLTAYNGSVFLRSEQATLSVPFTFRAVSEAMGDLAVTVVDELYYFTEEAPKLADASVMLFDGITGEIVAEGTTAADGRLVLPGVTEGYYTLEVRAADHETYRETVFVAADDVTEQLVFISRDFVKYVWTVEEVEIEDRTRITIESVFETNVPAPVVTIENGLIDLADLTVVGQTMQVDMTLTNHGLIAAQDVQLNFGTHPLYEIRPLVSQIGTLPAKSSLTVPVIVERISSTGGGGTGTGGGGDGTGGGDGSGSGDGSGGGDDSGGGSGGSGGGSGGGDGGGDGGGGNGGGDSGGGDGGGPGNGSIPCAIPASLVWSYPCGPTDVRRSTPIAVINVEGNCPMGPIGGGGGGATGGSGSGGGGGITPVVFTTPIDCGCDPNTFESRDLVKVDLLSLIQPAADGVNNILSLTAGAVLGFAPTFDFGVTGGARTCCSPDGSVGIELFGQVGGSGGFQIGNGINLKQSVNIGIAQGEASLKMGEFITPEAFATGEISSNCGEEPTATVTGGFRVNYFDGVRGSVGLSAGAGPVTVPIAGGSQMFGTDTILWEWTRTSTTPLSETEARTEIQALAATYADDFDGFVQAMQDSGEFRWNYFSTGVSYSAFFEYAGQQWSVTDDPNTPEIETSAYLVEPYERLDSNVGTSSSLVSWTLEEAEQNGVFTRPISELLTTITGIGFTGSSGFTAAPTAAGQLAEEPCDCELLVVPGSTDGVLAPAAVESVCAQVRLRIEQEAVMTRTAFEAGLELINGDSTSPLENVGVDLYIYDAQGNLVNDLFGIRAPILANVDAVDGTGTVASDTTGSARWVLIPTDEAAPNGPTEYFVGGLLTYTHDGQTLTIPLEPVEITVEPDAALHLKYFHERDVFSDDPFTDEIEPSIPFSLGVMVQNAGAGAARNLTITSAQPEIIENEKGLLIDFDIIATQVAGQNLTPSLTADFGDLAAGEIKVGQWLLKSSLQGHFIDYSATFEHLDGMGDERLSLIKSVEIYETIHVAQAGGSFEDGLPDFLTNELPDAFDLPDTLHLSDGSVASVGLGGSAAVDAAPDMGDLEIQLTAQMPGGWAYLELPDPGEGDYRLVRVLRSDGTEVPAANFWQTDRTFVGGGQRPIYEDNLHLFDYDSTGSYTLVYAPADQTGPHIVGLESVTPDPRTTGVESLTVTFSEPIDLASFDATDVILLRDGQAVSTAGVSLSFVSGATYELEGLTSLTGDDGTYTLTIDAAGLTDTFGNAGFGTAQESWVRAADGPTVLDIDGIDPSLRTTPISSVDVTFSEPINAASLDAGDLTLTRSDTEVPLSGTVTITQVSATAFRVGGLSAVTGTEGDYELSINAAGVTDLDGNPGIGTSSATWSVDLTGPAVVQITGTAAGPRNTPVSSVDVHFNEPPAAGSFDTSDIVLERDGVPLPLDGVSIVPVSSTVSRIAGLGGLTAADGQYTLSIAAGGLVDAVGNTGTATAELGWLMDTVAPGLATALAITPDNGVSNGDLATNVLSLVLSGTLPESGLSVELLDLTTGRNLGTGEVDGVSFSKDLTFSASGTHEVAVRLTDPAGNHSETVATLYLDVTQPVPLDPPAPALEPNTPPQETIEFVFSEPLDPSSFGREDLVLRRDGGPNLIGPGVTVEPVEGSRYRVLGLGDLNEQAGTYTLTANGAGVADLRGNAGLGSATATWTVSAELQLDLDTAVVAENDGSLAATATVTRLTSDVSQPLVVTIVSSDPGEATAPVSVTIPANETSVTFPIAAVPDNLIDGSQFVTFTVSADGFLASQDTLTVTDATQPELLSPSGSTSDATPTFTWTAIDNAARYDLWVYNETTQTHEVIREQDLTANSFTPADALPSGSYRFWVQAFTEEGLSSGWSPALTFSVGTLPDIPALVGPSGIAASNRPTFTWQDVGAARYDLWVYNVTTNTHEVIREQNLTTNSFTPDTDLPVAEYRFWVQAFNIAGQTKGWSAGLDFLVGSVTAVPTLLGPLGDTSETRPTFEWEAVDGAVRYDLWVYNATTDSHEVIREQNLTTTTFTPAADLSVGEYRFWVRAFNAADHAGDWSAAGVFRIGVLAAPQLLGPSGSTTETTPEFSWTAVAGAVHYDLWVYNVTTNTHQVIREQELTGTSFTPTEPLEAAQYIFWVRAINAEGLPGEWSDQGHFTVSAVSRSNASLDLDAPDAEDDAAEDTPNEWLVVGAVTSRRHPPADSQSRRSLPVEAAWSASDAVLADWPKTAWWEFARSIENEVSESNDESSERRTTTNAALATTTRRSEESEPARLGWLAAPGLLYHALLGRRGRNGAKVKNARRN